MGSDGYEPRDYWAGLHATGEHLAVVGHPSLPVAFNRSLYANTARAVLRTLRRAGVDLRGASILDIGSGTGFWLDLWLSEGARDVAGADLVPSTVDRLKRRLPGREFVAANIADASPFPRRTFDVVSVMNVLLHITDEPHFEAALAHLAAQLAPDGVLVVLDPVVVRRRWAQPRGDDEHNVVRTLETWEAASAAAGLRIARMAPAVAILSDPVDAGSRAAYALHRFWWRALTRLVRVHERLATVVVPPLAIVDGAVVRWSRTGPSTKCLVLRRAADAGP